MLHKPAPPQVLDWLEMEARKLQGAASAELDEKRRDMIMLQLAALVVTQRLARRGMPDVPR